MMAKIGRQLGGGGAATLEKVSMDLSSSVQSVAAPKLSDGDNGGNNRGKINNGGGGGDGERRRRLVRRRRRRRRRRRIHFFEEDPETFEREAIQAVLSEWFKTIASLPAGLRMAVRWASFQRAVGQIHVRGR